MNGRGQPSRPKHRNPWLAEPFYIRLSIIFQLAHSSIPVSSENMVVPHLRLGINSLKITLNWGGPKIYSRHLRGRPGTLVTAALNAFKGKQASRVRKLLWALVSAFSSMVSSFLSTLNSTGLIFFSPRDNSLAHKETGVHSFHSRIS